MEERLDELYNKIAEQIISMIPVDWSVIYYLGEVEKGKVSWSSVFYFIDSKNEQIVRSPSIPSKYNVSKKNQIQFELDDILLELYDCFEEEGQELWEQVSMTIKSTGKFNIDFKYDVFNESNRGPGGRETIWAYEICGFMHEKGTYFRDILDKYLEEKAKK